MKKKEEKKNVWEKKEHFERPASKPLYDAELESIRGGAHNEEYEEKTRRDSHKSRK